MMQLQERAFNNWKLNDGSKRRTAVAIPAKTKKSPSLVSPAIVPHMHELFDASIFFGDLNYRVNYPRNKVSSITCLYSSCLMLLLYDCS